MSNRFDEARRAAERLNAATDELNETLLAAERGILDLKLHLHVEVPLGTEGATTLMFGRQKGVWGLYVVTPSEIAHLVQTSRANRLLVTGAMDALLEALTAKAETEIAGVQAAVQAIESVIEALTGKPHCKTCDGTGRVATEPGSYDAGRVECHDCREE